MDLTGTLKDFQNSLLKAKSEYNPDEINTTKSYTIGGVAEEYDISYKIIQKSKILVWLRVYIKNELLGLTRNTPVKITYTQTGEVLNGFFYSYDKLKNTTASTNLDTSYIEQFDPENDNKALCLNFDSNDLDDPENKIPYLRTLFPTSKYYVEDILRHDTIKININGVDLDYYMLRF
jgi:hypothetical protein